MGEIREEAIKDPHGWWVPHHHMFGTQIRNLLREVVVDDQLPPVDYAGQLVCNWDDYYVAAIEEAAGITEPT